MKVILEASKAFFDAFVKEAKCSREEAYKRLKDVTSRRLELREGKDIVEIRETEESTIPKAVDKI